MDRKPDFLKINKIPVGEKASRVLRVIKENKLNTVCTEASCPNKGRCFAEGTATFLILGPTCTRNCKFCNIRNDAVSPEDINEAERVAEAAYKMGVSFVVITSVTRDDLPDRGANAFARTIKEVRKKIPTAKIEVLTPDFAGKKELLKIVIDEKPDVFNHNIETVKRLTPLIRSGADYDRSLSLLKMAKELNQKQITKSGLIVGLGEAKEEILDAVKDLVQCGVDRLTIGQYLQPSRIHYPVQKYYTPNEFEELKEEVKTLGIKWVLSGPFVRSSYMAHIAEI
ncbi:MAG: lipoyl synthase [Acidobacteria bacterium]|nr:lipoyl synthase [Acidobacteriota bacterium]